jgi:glycosyltransferase involved in cell wall biosynthesis
VGLPLVSVAVPTWNRAERLDVCVASLLAQDYPKDRYEVLVVDDGSTDNTGAVLDRLRQQAGNGPALRHFRVEHGGPNAARNMAFAHAAGDPICLVDDDEDVPPGWLTALVAGVLRHPEAGCVGGPMRLRLEGRPPRMCGRESLGESELDLGDEEAEVDVVWSGNMAVRRFALEQVGDFNEDLRRLGHTELEWVQRLRDSGGCVVYVPDAWLWHRRSQAELRLRSLVARNFTRGRGQAINGARFGLHYRPRRVLRNLEAGLMHAYRARCCVGLIRAAQHMGQLVGLAETRARRAIRISE